MTATATIERARLLHARVDALCAELSECLRGIAELTELTRATVPADESGHTGRMTSRDSRPTVDDTTFCVRWKGRACYWALASEPDGEPVAWTYPEPTAAFARIAQAFAFYPGRVACYVAGERVRPQPGYFYGGWITDEIAGPVKGEPGTGHW